MLSASYSHRMRVCAGEECNTETSRPSAVFAVLISCAHVLLSLSMQEAGACSGRSETYVARACSDHI